MGSCKDWLALRYCAYLLLASADSHIDSRRQEVYNAEMPLLAALAYPRASCKELRAILDYMTTSFMLEELTYAPFII